MAATVSCKTSMPEDELVKKGIEFLKAGNTLGALSCFEKAYAVDNRPEVRSYFGFCIAIERGQITEALKLCADAVSEEPDNPVNYLNYAKVCLKANMRDEGIKNLRKGLSFGDNQEIRAILATLGLRSKPVFPFLPRRHFLNKYSGLLLSKFRMR
jgi:tetratricopeptide (TPR) repeat protein